MKKLYLFLCIIALSSCVGVETPIFSDNCKNEAIKGDPFFKPFIVHKIERFDENNSRYTSDNHNALILEGFSKMPSFIAKNGLFVIGDTVKICK